MISAVWFHLSSDADELQLLTMAHPVLILVITVKFNSVALIII